MTTSSPIAIVGIGGVFPSSPDLDTYWEHILAGRDLAADLPAHRLVVPLDQLFDPAIAKADKVYARRGYFVDETTVQPDYSRLQIEKELVDSLDPMFKIGLTAAQQAFEDARMASVDRGRIGLIIGNIVLPTEAASALARSYLGAAFETQITGKTVTPPPINPLNARVAGLPGGVIARALALGGGSFTLDAACASSLYAIKLAADELIAGRADAMISGGISRPDCVYTQMGFSQLRALSTSGKASPFDKKADGLVVGEGAGMVVLKRLDDALAAGDQIYGLIRGAGLSNDLDGSLLAPDSEGQLRAMRSAYQQAGWLPWDLDMIECHATGTPLGDGVEVRSLQRLWQDAPAEASAVIGSVKANVGHLLTAAGSAALIKTLLAMKSGTLPPTANFHEPPADLKLQQSPFQVLKSPSPWPERNRPRRAAVSAFGFGGINAHLLIEAWDPQQPGQPQPQPEPCAVAVVGMEAHFGPWKGLDAFRDRVFGLDSAEQAPQKPHWWGLESEAPVGFYLKQLDIPLGRFRIPPKELLEMLPQQLLMLLTAHQALENIGYEVKPNNRAGAFVGIGLDQNTTNYQLRWDLESRARAWARTKGLDLDEADLALWVGQLREAMGPALNANRVIGGLGSITASRLAREFRFGGPSFTLSSEESSGIRALEAGIRALQQGLLDMALIGGVDFAGEVRAAQTQNASLPWSRTGRVRPFDSAADGPVPGEGAVAVVLKRLEDARRDGDPIYAIVAGIGIASDLETATARARSEAGPGPIDFLETETLAWPQQDGELLNEVSSIYPKKSPVLGALAADLGYCGAVSGLAAFARACLALKYERFPVIRNLEKAVGDLASLPQKPRFWLRNSDEGPRRAGVNSRGVDGVCAHVILESAGQPLCFPSLREVLLFVVADDLAGLIEALNLYRTRIRGADLYQLERENPTGAEGKLALAMVVGSESDLEKCLTVAAEALRLDPDKPENFKPYLELVRGRRLFFNPKPLGSEAKIAFVYPGSGSHFADMGRELALQWPAVFRAMDQTTTRLAEELQPECFWSGREMSEVRDQQAMLLSAQVALGVTVTDLVRRFGLEPAAAIGYSLGESTAFLSLGSWQDRDGMHFRTRDSALFSQDLAGPCLAVRKTWGLADHEVVDWILGVVICTADQARRVLARYGRAYLLIVNTPKECVIGGDRSQVLAAVEELKTRFFPLHGVVTVHCEVLEPVAEAYRSHHLFPTTPPEGIQFYSGCWARSYPVTRESAADAVLAQARHGVDYPKTIEAAYGDGYNLFLEMGPGSSCTRMINKILGKRRHLAVSACFPGAPAVTSFLRMLGLLISERIPLDLSPLLAAQPLQPKSPQAQRSISLQVGGDPFIVPPPPHKAPVIKLPQPPEVPTGTAGKGSAEPKPDPRGTAVLQSPVATGGFVVLEDLNQSTSQALSARARAHEAFLRFSQRSSEAMIANLQHQMNLIQGLEGGSAEMAMAGQFSVPVGQVSAAVAPAPVRTAVFDRDMCMEFAVGTIGRMLGAEFAPVDQYPTRVRLPAEPLMLVDRITHVEGKTMESGQVITEHDVLVDGWYLDCGRIPTCIAIEAGQADLFLSAWLGVDFQTKGLSSYRLLDAQVVFHDELPKPGEVIVYDIRILRFFRQADTHFFYFQFEGSVNGRPLLTMRDGCAGFFSPKELAAGKGVVRSKDSGVQKSPQDPAELWRWLPVEVGSYGVEQLNALRRNDLAGCFGPAFANLGLVKPLGLPDGLMNLVHRVTLLDPAGGDYGIGLIRAEADIHPEDWFLTCHFIDDMVMPGTLMYECCLHTMRVFLYRMGWVGEADEVVCQPMVEVASRLKCRGQVLRDTRVVTYEVHIKKVGYDPEPHAIADALMYSDNKAIVDISDMCIRFSGLTLEKLEQTWGAGGTRKQASPPPVFTYQQLLAFASGKPSQAFGQRYLPFDSGRKIARFPSPPFLLMSRVEHTDVQPWTLTDGGKCRVIYDIPTDAWYFHENRQPLMPYSILLEIALQSCGWLAAYMGSALYSQKDLLFRNLGGNAVQHLPVTPETGSLKTHVTVTSISRSGDVILQFFDYQVFCSRGLVFEGDTYFGFFTPESMANQVGIREATPFEPGQDLRAQNPGFQFPKDAPFPAPMMRMVDRIDLCLPDGGAYGLGFIEGSIDVDPDAWFFRAHFYQDPVWPGSLGLESFIQVLEAFAHQHWGTRAQTRFQAPHLNTKHSWSYRGQILPGNKRVRVQASIRKLDPQNRVITADGFLLVDDLAIYQMTDFSLKLD